MASISKRSSYVEFKVERAADIDVGSSDDEETAATNANATAITVATKKPKHRWTCGLRRSSSSSTAPVPSSTLRKTELKVSFTVQFVHSFCLRVEPNAALETHNIPHGDETQLRVTLQDPRQQSGATWRKLIASTLSGSVPGPLMDAMAWKLQRDLAALPVPPPSSRAQAQAQAQARRSNRLLVLHVHVAVKVVTPDGVTAETLLDRVSTPVVESREEGVEGGEEDCVICLEKLGVERGSIGLEVRRMLVCSHEFHGECLLRWVLKTASCPVCWSRCLGLFLPKE